jgi:hypothetical protein
MITKKSISWIIILIIIFEFIILFQGSTDKKTVSVTINDPFLLLIPPLIILMNVMAKEIASGFFSIKINHSVWEFYRWGIYKRSHLKKPMPIGLILPFFLTFFSLGMIKPLFFLQFDAENDFEKRILKQRGRIRKMQMNDSDAAFTAAWGFLSLLALALIGVLLKFPELIKYPVYYGLWNLIPFGKLDGARMFFGSVLTWSTITLLYLISGFLIVVFLF